MKRRRPGEHALKELIDGAEQTYQRCMAAVRFDGLALRLIDKPCQDARFMAILQNPEALKYITDPNSEEVYTAMRAEELLREQRLRSRRLNLRSRRRNDTPQT